MLYFGAFGSILCSFSLLFVLPISGVHVLREIQGGQTAHQNETTENKWQCYKDQFAHAPGHSLQAPCLRVISPSSGAVAMAGGTGIHPVRIQADAGMMSPPSIQLRWTIIIAAIRRGGREESYPVKKCRNETSCAVHVPSNAYHHGNPVLMVTGSYQSTPWMKTVLRVSLQEQSNHGEEVLLLVPRQILRDNSKWRSMVNPRNSLKNQETPVPQVTRVRRVRRGRNNLTSHQEQTISNTLPGRTFQVPKGPVSVKTWPQTRNPSMRAVRKSTRALRRKRLSARSDMPNIEHQSTASRLVRGFPLSSTQSSRHLPQRRENREVNIAQALGYQSPRQQSHGAVRRQTVSGAHRGYRQPTSAGKTSHQSSLQPLQSQKRPPEQPIGPYSWQGHFANPSSINDIYRQRIQSEVNTLRRLQTSWHHKEKQYHQRQKQKKNQKRQRVHRHRIMKKLQDLRTDHLSRLNRLIPGEIHSHESSSPHPSKPPKIIQNYYPFVPHRRVEEYHGTAAPNIITKHATTTESTTKATPTTTASSPAVRRPLSNRERMQNDRMEYQRLRSNYQKDASNEPRRATNIGRRYSGAYERVSSTNREDGLQIPGRSKFETGNRKSGHEVADNNEGFPDYAHVDIPAWTEDGETISSVNLPEISQHEELGVRLLQDGTNSPNPTRKYSKDDPQSKTPDDNIKSDFRESWAEYSDFLSANHDEIENKIGENNFNAEDGADAIYDTGVSVDTWGEVKSTKSKPDQSIIDALNRRLVKQNDSLSLPVTSDKIMPELGMPRTEQAFRALQQEIINEERNEPENQEDITPRYSAEFPDVRQNVPRIIQGFRSSTGNKRYGRSNYLRSAIGPKVARARASRSVKEESDFETSASEPIEYSYNPSSDLHETHEVPGEFAGDVHGRFLDEDKFDKLQEEILEEERVGKSQRNSGGNTRDGLSYDRDGIKGIRNGPVGRKDRLTGITLSRNDLSPNNHRPWEWQQNNDVTLDESYLEHIGLAENNAAATADRPSAPERELTSIYDDEAEGRREGAYNPVSGEKSAPQSQSEEWSEWSHCSHSCRYGTKIRHRACTGRNTNTCPSGVEYDVLKCALQKCPDAWDGAAVEVEEEASLSQWRDWSGWSMCSVSCGSGLRHRQRTCLQDPDKEHGCTGQHEESRTCRLDGCNNVGSGWKSKEGTARRIDPGQHHHHTKRIKCHLDESRSHLPIELFWTSPSGEKITHAMTHERNSKYHIEGTTLVVTEDEPSKGSYHCIVIYGGSRGSNNKGKTAPMGACLSHPCHHKGVCLDQPSAQYNVSYRCMCPAGYEGMRCHMAPYLKGDAIVFSLLGWFIASSTVIMLVLYFGCSKKMKKRKMKLKLELDDAPAEKLLAKILPQIETSTYPDSDADEDTKPLLSFLTPQMGKKLSAKEAIRTSSESTEKREQSGKVRFKSIANKVKETTGKKVEGFSFPTLKQMKSLTEEIKAQRNRKNSITVDLSSSEGQNSTLHTTHSSSSENLSERDDAEGSSHSVNYNMNNDHDSSFESLPGKDNAEGCSQLVNHNMNNCSWDYSSVSSCAPCDLNSSSIVGNDDDSLMEISTDDFRDFQVASAFSVFKGSPSTRKKQAVINPSLVYGNANSTLVCSRSLLDEMPHASEKHPMFHFEPTATNLTVPNGNSNSTIVSSRSLSDEMPHASEKHPMFHFEPTATNLTGPNGNSKSTIVSSRSLSDEMSHASEKHPMFHFEPTATNLTGPSDCSPERQNYGGNGCGLVPATSPRRCERPWSMRTPSPRGNGVRVRLPPSPSLSVSPSRLPLPPTGQRASRMFGPTDEHAILEHYRKRRTTHPKHVRSPVSFETSPQESLDAAHPVIGEYHRDRKTSGTSSPCFHRDRSHGSDSFVACYRDRSISSPGSEKQQEYSVATGNDSFNDLTSIDTLTDEKPSRRKLPTNRSLFRERVSDSSLLLHD